MAQANPPVLRMRPPWAAARRMLGRRLRQVNGRLVVEFDKDLLPAGPWPELADPRVSVAFARAMHTTKDSR